MNDLPTVRMNDLRRLYVAYAQELEQAATETIRSGWWLNGHRGKTFAADFARYLGTSACTLVANGTDALELALSAVAAAKDNGRREVVLVANAGGYAATACWHNGLLPHFVDVVGSSQLMSIPAAVAATGKQTLAVLVTHLYGGASDVRALRSALDGAGHEEVAIIEDCAQAHGARINGEIVGALGDVSTFSFYPTKNLGAMGDGGAVCTSDDAIARNVELLHQYGWTSKYRVGIANGRNSRMDEIQAALLAVLLPKLEERNRRRRNILDQYRAATGKQLIFVDGGPGSVAHLAVLLCDNRDEFREFMTSRGVETDIHYPVLDCDQTGWSSNPYLGAEGLEATRETNSKLCSVPCHPDMTESETSQVCTALSDWDSK